MAVRLRPQGVGARQLAADGGPGGQHAGVRSGGRVGGMGEPLAARLVFWAYFLTSAGLLFVVQSRLESNERAAAAGWRIAFIAVATLAPAAVELADGWNPMPSPASASRMLRTPPIETLDLGVHAQPYDRLNDLGDSEADHGRP